MIKVFITSSIIIILNSISFVYAQNTNAQTDSINSVQKKDTLSKFDRFNKKAEHLFKILPVPIYSYSTETGHLFGLAKYNIFRLVKNDTVSVASKVAGVFTFSTLGHISVGGGSTLNFGKGKYMFETGVGYKEFPEFILGIGNDVSRDNLEEIKVSKLSMLFKFFVELAEDLQIGPEYFFNNYFSIEKEDSSFLIKDDVLGKDGGFSSGLGLAVIYDKRDYRYNPSTGGYVSVSFDIYNKAFGSDFNYNNLTIDLRKYFNPWLNHVLAFQLYTEAKSGNVPFYELCMMGGPDRMRGYYKGVIRDKAIVDGQFEYRMPVWKIFGATAFVGAGRVAQKFTELDFNGLWYSYGFGLRIMVDSENRANLRIDFGFGQENARGVYIGFTEAF